ncbi:MAG TPA: MFS transporter [Hyphomicrobiales bacterium]|nr:MFS transporter [Hyphomicrobiales bacterium]
MTATRSRPASTARAALAHRGFRLYWIARVLSSFGIQIVSVAVGWHIYAVTREALLLGFVGLVQFAPSLGLVLVTGTVADRVSRRGISAACLIGEAALAVTLLVLVALDGQMVWPIFPVLAGFGVARAFLAPAMQALVPNLVPPEDLASAIALNSATFQIGIIVGPVTGGLLYGISAEAAFGAAVACLLVASGCMLRIVPPPQRVSREPATLKTIVAGFGFIWRHPLVLGSISLDLFAVLLGGATALLPVYARDILHVGPWGLGLLRAGIGIGAILMAIYLGIRPLRDHAGAIMFVAVGFFGLFTVVFGVSTTAWLSVVALIVMGAADMISVYVRETLIQLATPDAVRGRVSAVNSMFIGASNELGEFRAGGMAALIGAVPAVVLGGFATVAVAALWAWWFPALRRARHLDEVP